MTRYKEVFWTSLLTGFLVLLVAQTGLAQIEDVPIWRLQIEAHTCDVSKAGSSDHVSVKLNDDALPFFMDLGGKERKRDETVQWDIFMDGDVDDDGILDDLDGDGRVEMDADRDGLIEMRDITRLEFQIHGGDGWCFESISILVNEQYVYHDTRRFWIDGDDGRPSQIGLASPASLRANEYWVFRPALLRPAVVLERDVLESMIEGIVGNLMGPDGEMERLKWGSKRGRDYVELEPAGAARPNVADVDLDLNLKGRKSVFRRIDVDFDLRVSCVSNVLTMDVMNIDADLPNAWRWLAIGFENQLIALFADLSDRLGVVAQPLGFCPSINFNEDGDLVFSLPTAGSSSGGRPTSVAQPLSLSSSKALVSHASVLFQANGTGIAESSVQVYALSGSLLFDSQFQPGNALRWSGLDAQGRTIANGVYLYVVSIKGSNGGIVRSEIKKLVVMQ